MTESSLYPTGSTVVYEYEHWVVVGTEVIDDQSYLTLRRPSVAGERSAPTIAALPTDVVPYYPPTRKRKLKDDDYVLEFDTGTGGIAIRKKGSRKRYLTSLPAIYSMTVKAHVNMQKALRKIKRRKGKV